MASDDTSRGVPVEPFGLGEWTVEPGLNRLVDARGAAVALEPRAMDVLLCLARHAGTTVSKEQLLDEVWHGAFVVEGVIPKTVFALRHALGDDANAPRYVLTVPRRGYRLIAEMGPATASPAGELAAELASAPAVTGEAPGVAPEGGAPPAPRRRGRSIWIASGLLLAVAIGWAMLRRPGPEAADPRIARLAVAPFEALGGPDSEVLAAALRAETVGELVRFERPSVHLVGAGASGREGAFAGAREVRADALLVGAVDTSSERVRVDLQLIDPASRRVAWTASFDRTPSELFELRRAIASAVAVRLGAQAAEPPAPVSRASVVLGAEAYRSFLEARHLWARRGQGDLLRALRLFEKVARDAPDSGEAQAWMALALVTGANYLGLEPIGALGAAEQAARRAVELAPDDPVAHTAAGLVAINRHAAVEEAVAEYRRAIALAPSFATPRQFLAEALAAAGRHEEALATIEQAVALEPLSPVVQAVQGLVLYAAGREGDALEQFDRVLVLEPRFTWLHRYRGYSFVRLGRGEEAGAALLAEAEAQGETAARLAGIREAFAREGIRGYWRWRVDRLDEIAASGRTVRPSQLAEALAGAGRHDEALAALEGAVAAGDGEYFLYARWSPAFDALRDDPRFGAIYSRRGL